MRIMCVIQTENSFLLNVLSGCVCHSEEAHITGGELRKGEECA